MRKLVYSAAAMALAFLMFETPASSAGLSGAFQPSVTSVGLDRNLVTDVNYRYYCPGKYRYYNGKYRHYRRCVMARRHYYPNYYAYPYENDYYDYGYGPPAYYGMPFLGFSFGFGDHDRRHHHHMNW